MAETRRFSGVTSRSQLKALNNLGIVSRPLSGVAKQFRKPELDALDAYYEGRQYAGMPLWMDAVSSDGSYIPIRSRQPMLQLNFAKILTSRIASKLVGRRNFPELTIEDDPETSELISLVIKQAQLKSLLMEPVRRMLNSGSVLVRFSIIGSSYKVEHFLSKWCFPEFDETGNLSFVRIQYVFEDENDKDPSTRLPKKKWFKMELSQNTDILYDNPEFKSEEGEPVFQVVNSVAHNLGFVQAEWMRTSKLPNTVDGPSLIADILGFIDELNYNFSQSSQAVSYNQDPQLTFKNMDEDEMQQLIRSSVKGWNLGKDGDASFLESEMSGVQVADEFRDKVRLSVQDIARVTLLDPEKIVGSAQSGKAMEVLHGPMVELIEELQPVMERSIISLVLKMTLTTMLLAKRGVSPINIPPNFVPKSLNLSAIWPDIFPRTMQDLQQKVQVASTVSSANLISRETLTKWLAKEFGVENIEEEVAKVNAQPVINPFGGF